MSLKKSLKCTGESKNCFTYTVFPLIMASGAARIGGRRLKEGGAYLKVRKIFHAKFQNSINFSFQLTINSSN